MAPSADMLEEPSEREKPILGWKEKFNFFRKNITVEPIVMCYIIPNVFYSLATQNLNLEKACRVNLGYPTKVCDALTARNIGNYMEEEKQVQLLVAQMGIWKPILQSGIPAILMMFVGSWSDKWGRRKPCILVPVAGELMTVTGLMLCTYFERVPMEVCGFVEGFFPAITGGWFMMLTGVFCYIGDVSTVETRTLRIGIVNVFSVIGIPIGQALSGIALQKIGFYGVFAISAIMYITGIIYGSTTVEEPKSLEKNRSAMTGKHSFFKDFFDFKHVTQTFKVAFKEGPNNRKKKILLLMVVVMVVVGPMHGEMPVNYLSTRFRFGWNELDFSLFSTYSTITNFVGTLISVGIFSHRLKVDDAIVGIYSTISKISSSFVYCFAKTTLVFYLGSIVEIFNGTSFIAMRSIISKLVPSDELGKVSSIIAVVEALMPLVYAPMYNATYAATISTLPGAFFLLGGILLTPAAVIFGWFYFEHKKVMRLAHQEEEVHREDESNQSPSTISTKELQQPPPLHSISYEKTLVKPHGLPDINKENDGNSNTVPSQTDSNKGMDNIAFEPSK